MIYIFTGNSDFLVSDALKKWKNQFIEKYGEFNFSHLKDLEKINLNILKENILSESFFSEKKLIIIDLKDKEEKKKAESNQEKKENSEKEDNFSEEFLKILEKKPENNIIILNYYSPDKRKKFWKNLVKISELKKFNLKDDKQNSDTKNFLLSKYSGKIDETSIDLLQKYKANNLQKIISEIEKLLITKEKITKKDIIENIIPELEASVFEVVDLLLNKQKPESIQKIGTILNDTNIFAFYNNLLSNLRTNLYILKLKKQNASKYEISKILDLGKKDFLVDKKYKITYEELKKFYISLVKIDKNMKTGKFVSSEEDDIKMEIEKCIVRM